MSISPSYIKFRILNILTIYWTLYSLYNYVAVVGPCLARVVVTLFNKFPALINNDNSNLIRTGNL